MTKSKVSVTLSFGLREACLPQCDTDSAFIKSLQLNLSRLIAYAESADVKLQREVRRYQAI
jgi:hypothetical protein